MAKGDKTRQQTSVNNATDYSRQDTRNTQNVVNTQNADFGQNYQRGAQNNLNDYDSIMNQYRTFLGQPPVNSPGNTSAPAMGGNQNYQQQFEQWFPEQNLTPDMIKAKEQELVAAGWKLRPNAEGVVGKVQTPDGRIIDVIQGASSGLNRRQWLEPDDAGGGIMSSSLGGYSDFARTGGFSNQDIQNIRARSVAPIRGVYSAAQDNIDRQRKLQNGFSPNYTAATAKMARDLAYGLSDQTTNVEGMLAGMKNQGKLAGLAGLQSGILGANQGMTGMYGSTPGMANTFGSQVLNSTGQMLQGNALQNDTSRMNIAGQQGVAQIPSNFQAGMGNISSVLDLISQGATTFSGLGGLGNTANLPSRQTMPNVGTMPPGLTGR